MNLIEAHATGRKYRFKGSPIEFYRFDENGTIPVSALEHDWEVEPEVYEMQNFVAWTSPNFPNLLDVGDYVGNAIKDKLVNIRIEVLGR